VQDGTDGEECEECNLAEHPYILRTKAGIPGYSYQG
jgi:hypothetical protein